jgi:CubicO group peptidase (beta-lactamase class C family)
VEKMRGGTWDRALREQLIAPIGASTFGTLPEEAVLRRTAVGHVIEPGSDTPEPAPVWSLQRSNGPAGATPFGAARELLKLARLHLDVGSGPDGSLLLSERSVRAMQEAQIAPPAGAGVTAWGLGWMLFDWSHRRLIGHDGATIGQNAYLRIVPDARTAVALLSNGGNTAALSRRVFSDVLGELCDIEPPPLPEPSTALTLDLEPYTGVYERLAARCEVELQDGELLLRTVQKRAPIEQPEGPRQTLRPIDRSSFLVETPGSRFRTVATFLDPDALGRPRAFFSGLRAHPRSA